MTTTTTIGSTTDTATAPLERETGAGFATATVQSARRTFLQYLRTPQLLVLPTIIGAMFLFIFRYVFGGAIDAGNGVDYVDFLVPGFLLTTILWTGMNAPAGIAEDAASGVHDRFRSLPIPRTAVVAGRSLADGALVSWTLLVNAVLGFAVGFRTHGGIAAAVGAFVVMLVATFAATSSPGLRANAGKSAVWMGRTRAPAPATNAARMNVVARGSSVTMTTAVSRAPRQRARLTTVRTRLPPNRSTTTGANGAATMAGRTRTAPRTPTPRAPAASYATTSMRTRKAQSAATPAVQEISRRRIDGFASASRSTAVDDHRPRAFAIGRSSQVRSRIGGPREPAEAGAKFGA